MALLEVGHVVKPHGLRGEVEVTFVTNRDERMRVGTVLGRAGPGAGPLCIESIRGEGAHRLVQFVGVSDRQSAEQLRGELLFAEAIEDPDALFVHDLIGAEVFDTGGVRHGVVTSVEANPASDLLVVDGRVLVPLRFVVEHATGRVVVDAPSGIFE